MKRSLVFEFAKHRPIPGIIKYPPPLVNPDYKQAPTTDSDDKMAFQNFVHLLARYKQAGNEVAQQWRQDNLY